MNVVLSTLGSEMGLPSLVSAGAMLGSTALTGVGVALPLVYNGIRYITTPSNNNSMPANRTPSRARSVSRGRRSMSARPGPSKKIKIRSASRKKYPSRSPSKRSMSRVHSRDIFSTSQLPVSSVGQQNSYNGISLYCDMSTTKKNLSASGRIIYRQLYNAFAGSGAGEQQYNEIINFLTYKQVMVGSVVGGGAVIADIRTSGAALFALQPNQQITGSKDTAAVTMITAGSAVKQDRIVVKSVSFTMDMVNVTNHQAWVDVDIYICKRDGTENPAQVAQRLFIEQSFASGAAPTFTSSALGAGIAVGSAYGYNQTTVPGVKLEKAHTLGTYWKKCTSKAFVLASGAQQRFNGNIKLNKILKQEDFTGKSAQDFIKGYSISVVARTCGQVVIDETVGGIKEPTYGGCKIGIVTNVVYNMATVKSPAGRLNVDYTVRGIPYNTLPGVQTSVGIDGVEDTFLDITT